MVVENGGTFSMNLNSSVTHCIASESKGIKFQAAKRHGDVIHYSWLLECCAQKQLLPLQPKYFVFLSEATKKKLEEEVDEFSDSYYVDLNVAELEKILNNINKIGDSKANEICKKKYCPREEWVRFHGCCVYFHLPMKLLKNRNWETPFELATRRMKIEICIGGGSIAQSLSHATHLVIVSTPEVSLDFDTLLNSFSEAERRLLRHKRLQIVKSHWLDDCSERKHRLPEDSYNLKPQQFQEASSEESDVHERAGEAEHHGPGPSSSIGGERDESGTPHKPRVVSLPGKRKRGRPSGTRTGKQKPPVNPPRKARPRTGKKPAKISEYESDNDASSDDNKDSKLSSFVATRRNEPRRTRAQPIQINENESDEDFAAEMQTTDENLNLGRTEQRPSSDSHKMEAPKDSIPNRGKAVELGFTESSNEVNKSETGEGSSNRMEDNVDPIQAMLNMLPGLATKKVEIAEPVREDVKVRAPDPDPVEKDGKLPEDAEREVVKKRKVSYKDMVNELLKDW